MYTRVNSVSASFVPVSEMRVYTRVNKNWKSASLSKLDAMTVVLQVKAEYDACVALTNLHDNIKVQSTTTIVILITTTTLAATTTAKKQK